MRSLSRAICFAATLAGTSPSAQIRLDFNNDAHPDVIWSQAHAHPGVRSSTPIPKGENCVPHRRMAFRGMALRMPGSRPRLTH